MMEDFAHHHLPVPLVEGDLKLMYSNINESAKESASASSDTDDISFEEQTAHPLARQARGPTICH
jgi:hypothetical protein